MRIHVRGMQDVYGNKVTYVQESTGETDLEEARRYALDKYDDLRLRAKKKEPVKQLTFEDLYVIWWADTVSSAECAKVLVEDLATFFWACYTCTAACWRFW